MPKSPFSNVHAVGDALLSRARATRLPPALGRPLRQMRSAHRAFVGLMKQAEAAKRDRDGALSVLGNSAVQLSTSLGELSAGLVELGAATARRPFGRASADTPAALASPVPAALKKIDALVLKVGKGAKGPLRRLLATVRKDAAALRKALKSVEGSQARVARAQTATDGSLPAWAVAYAAFHAAAWASLRGDRPAYDALCAPIPAAASARPAAPAAPAAPSELKARTKRARAETLVPPAALAPSHEPGAGTGSVSRDGVVPLSAAKGHEPGAGTGSASRDGVVEGGPPLGASPVDAASAVSEQPVGTAELSPGAGAAPEEPALHGEEAVRGPDESSVEAATPRGSSAAAPSDEVEEARAAEVGGEQPLEPAGFGSGQPVGTPDGV